jgi:hypothetical protein
MNERPHGKAARRREAPFDMKKLWLLLLLASSAQAQEAKTTLEGKWEYVAKNESGSLFYLDASKITDVAGKAGSKRVWLLVDTETKQLRAEVEFSCTENTFLAGPEYQHKKSGALLTALTEWDAEPTSLAEGSVFELIKNHICNP